MGWIEGTQANIDAAFTTISNALLGLGATRYVVNSLATNPGNGLIGRVELFVLPGTSGRQSCGGLGIFRGTTSAAVQFLETFTFSGLKLLSNISVINKPNASQVVTVTHDEGGTPGTNPFRTGDHVIVICTDTTIFNEGFITSESAPAGSYSITRTGNTTFTYTTAVAASPAQSGAAGKCIAIQNLNGVFGVIGGTGVGTNLTDGPMVIHGYCDEFGFGCVIEQGGTFQILLARNTERDVSQYIGDVAKTTAPAAAGANVSIAISSASNIRIGQKIMVVHPGWDPSSPPAGDAATFEVTTVTGRADNTHVTATLVNSYPTGAILGHDPACWMVIGRTNNSGATTQALDSLRMLFMFNVDGTRTSPIAPIYQCGIEIPSGSAAANVNPDDAINPTYRVRDITFFKSASPSKGWRGFARPLFGLSHGTDNAGDIAGTGATTVDDFKSFPAITLNSPGGFTVCIGPGATP
jgi:hypothetical protein